MGAIKPLYLGSLLPVFFDIGLKRLEEVVTAQLSESRSLELPSSPVPRGSMSAKRCVGPSLSL